MAGLSEMDFQMVSGYRNSTTLVMCVFVFVPKNLISIFVLSESTDSDNQIDVVSTSLSIFVLFASLRDDFSALFIHTDRIFQEFQSIGFIWFTRKLQAALFRVQTCMHSIRIIDGQWF